MITDADRDGCLYQRKPRPSHQGLCYVCGLGVKRELRKNCPYAKMLIALAAVRSEVLAAAVKRLKEMGYRGSAFALREWAKEAKPCPGSKD